LSKIKQNDLKYLDFKNKEKVFNDQKRNRLAIVSKIDMN
jgi:hypothetical protein